MKAGWERKRLGELLQKTGSTDPTKEPEKPFTYIDVSSVSNETFTIRETSELLGKDAPSRARRSVRSGDVIFATIRPTLKRIAIVPDELDNAVCSTGYFVLRGGSKIDNGYLFYWLFSGEFEAEMEARQKGASYPAVNDSDIRDQYLPVPPLEEQQRIVAVLDKAFAGIATATANAQKNLTNARALFESSLQRIYANRSARWQDFRLGDVASRITDGTHLSPKYVPSGVAMLDSKHIGDAFEIEDQAATKFISSETDRELAKRCKPTAGDILISSRGSIGKIAIVRPGQNFNIMGNMILVRLPAHILPEYGAFFFYSEVSKMQAMAQGVAQKGLYLNQIREYVLPVPPIEEQHQIVQKLGNLLNFRSAITLLYERKLTALTELKQSLLQKAFAGELT